MLYLSRRSYSWFYFLVSLLVITGWVWVLLNVLPGRSHLIMLCWFKHITGLPCPSCGTTASVIHILHGHYWEALTLNVLGYIELAGLILLPVWLLSDAVRASAFMFRVYEAVEKKLKEKPVLLIVLLLLIGLNWGWKLWRMLNA